MRTRIAGAKGPLTPAAVGTLVADRDIPVHVQTSDNRIFSDDSYRSEGATLVDDLADAEVISRSGRSHRKKLAAERTYVFFSHTIKANHTRCPCCSGCWMSAPH